MKRILLTSAVLTLLVGGMANATTILGPHSTWEYTFADPTASSTWNTTTGGWTTGAAPFGNNIGGYATDPTGDFDYNTFWAADGRDGDDLWVRTALDLTGYDLSTIQWDLGVDNGFTLFMNGVQVASVNAEGYTSRWEYSGSFGGLNQGLNVLAVALEDHGGLTAFDMQVTGTPVPEPGTMILLGSGLLGLAGFARRKRQ